MATDHFPTAVTVPVVTHQTARSTLPHLAINQPITGLLGLAVTSLPSRHDIIYLLRICSPSTGAQNPETPHHSFLDRLPVLTSALCSCRRRPGSEKNEHCLLLGHNYSFPDHLRGFTATTFSFPPSRRHVQPAHQLLLWRGDIIVHSYDAPTPSKKTQKLALHNEHPRALSTRLSLPPARCSPPPTLSLYNRGRFLLTQDTERKQTVFNTKHNWTNFPTRTKISAKISQKTKHKK